MTMTNRRLERQLQQLAVRRRDRAPGRTLYVYVGPADPQTVESLRSGLPPACPLLYLYEGGESDAMLPPPGRFVIAAPRQADGIDTAILVANCLKPRSVRLSFSNRLQLPEGWASLLETQLQATVRGIEQEKLSRLINLHCGVANLPRLPAGTTEIAVPPGTPALICGAGPSLETQLDILRRLQGKVYLIAVGKLAPLLLRRGIRADAAVYVDTGGYGLDWSPLLSTGQTLLVTLTTAAPEVAAAARKVLFAPGPSPFLSRAMADWGARLPELFYAGTGTVTALDFARHYGFAPIALIGNDLCRAPGGQAHLPDYGGDDLLESRETTIPGNDGPVVTTPELQALKNLIEAYLAAHPLPVYNCTAGGAVIAGTVRGDLMEIVTPHIAANHAVTDRTIPPPAGFKPTWNRWLEAGAQEHAAHLTLEAPALDGDAAEALEHRLAKEFTADLKERFDRLGTRPATEVEIFPGFRRFAVDRIRRSDPALADWLASRPEQNSPRFRLHCNFTESACVVRQDGERETLLTGSYLTMQESAESEIGGFLAAHDFAAARDALIVVAPASWHHPMAVAAQCPEAAMMVLEPWPDLLAMLIGRCMFLHRLPADAAIIGAGPELPDWRRRAQQQLRLWRQAGRRTLVFVNPHADAMPEVREIVTALAQMMPDRSPPISRATGPADI